MNTDRGFQALLMNGESSLSSSSFFYTDYTSPIVGDGYSTADLFSFLNPSPDPLYYSIPAPYSNPIAGFVNPKIEPAEAVTFVNNSVPEIEMYTSSLARNRRHKYSDKIRCLQKILPWDKKMNMATMLEEAYKYVKFLQAQVSILQSMPCNSLIPSSSCQASISPIPGDIYGGLGRLNRQQLLQVLVNSPVAQTVLYSRGCCVYSFEQLGPLREIEKSKANNQMAHQIEYPYSPMCSSSSHNR